MPKVKSITPLNDGMSLEQAEDLWTATEGFAAYSFNKSHAAEYSLISYQGMYLKAHYPVEFYAAALSVLDEAKTQPIVVDAQKSGIEVLPPDINQSEDDYVIANDTTLLAPLTSVKNVSSNSMKVIRQIRSEGSVKGIDDLKNRLREAKLGRWCNSRAIDHLDKVGAFWKLEPGQKPANSSTRLKDQNILMPGVMTSYVPLDRVLPRDEPTRAKLRDVVKRYSAEDEDAVHINPNFGKRAKFMVVADAPTMSEESSKHFVVGRGAENIDYALSEAGLKKSDGYWTGLLKRTKEDKLISTDEIKTYLPYLLEEIDILKPPLIITLGSQSSRQLIPDLKDNILDHTGRHIYSKSLDATVLIGFNPGMIHFDESKMDILINLFKTAKDIIEAS